MEISRARLADTVEKKEKVKAHSNVHTEGTLANVLKMNQFCEGV